MADQILVIEYEPRYTERIREALSAESVDLAFARDGDEALRFIDDKTPGLIILSSVIPRYGTAELIRQIRTRSDPMTVPILLAMSGYGGSNTRADAVRFGANDIIPKPFAQAELRSRVLELLGIAPAASESETGAAPPADPVATVRISTRELLADLAPEPDRPRRKSSAEDDVDRMLADTLSGVRLPGGKRKVAEGDKEKAAAKTRDATDELDRLLQDTLAGMDVKRPRVPDPETRPPTPVPGGTVPVEPLESIEPPVPPPAGPVSREAVEPVAEPSAESQRERATPPGASIPDLGPTILARKPDEEQEIESLRAKAEPTPEPEIDDGTRFGQYILLERIATGGMAEIWKARMRGVEGFEKIVAIKKILPHLSDNQEFVEMFVDEAKLAAQLNHNNIIHIYDLGKISDSYYIAMEYVDGHDLKSILKRASEAMHPLSTELALSVASKLAAALDYAHRKRGFEDQDLGIVHRDVSPQNVLISYEGDIKLCDFGIAKAATKASHTQAGALKGKLQYMSPEQAWGRSIDKRSDVFSLTAVLFEMLAGRKLFAGDSEISILDQVREARITAPSAFNDELAKEVDELVLRGLARDPDARFQTAGEMARAIDSVLFSYRPTPTAADLAIYMHRLYRVDEEPVIAPNAYPMPMETQPVGTEPDLFSHPTTQAPMAADLGPAASPVAEAETPSVSSPLTESESGPATLQMPFPETRPADIAETPARKSKKPLAIVAGLLVAVGAGAGGWYFMMGPGSAKAPGSALPVAAAPARQPSSPPVPQPAITPEAAATENQTALDADDLALIDQEVRKRVEEERKRLEGQENKAAAGPASAVETKPTQPRVVEAAPPLAPVEPRLSAETSKPAPAESSPVESRPIPSEPVVSAPPPVAQRVKEGDLVQPGTPGLVEPVLISLRKLAYPQLARRQRVEGIVFVRVLVSEGGKALEAEILRGVPQNVGINEVARDMVLGGKFKPATKDGVNVKAYKTIPIPFKL